MRLWGHLLWEELPGEISSCLRASYMLKKESKGSLSSPGKRLFLRLGGAAILRAPGLGERLTYRERWRRDKKNIGPDGLPDIPWTSCYVR